MKSTAATAAEPARCPVCGTEDDFPTVFSGDHTLVECTACALLFSRRIFQKNFFDFYSTDEGGFYESPYFQAEDPVLEANPDYPNYKTALERAKNLAGGGAQPLLLDVGCGKGTLLRIAKALGLRAEGLEITALAGQNPKGEFKIHLYAGSVESIPPIGPFDVITMWDVLEHLPDPVGYLAALKRLLKPDGALVIRTINENCLLSTAALWSARLTGGLFKALAQRMHEKYHVIYFTNETLSMSLVKAGYIISDTWGGEFPAERATSSNVMQIVLRCAYALQKILNRPFEQYVIAKKTV